MARFAVSDRDTNRRSLAFLYGMNTLGAVVGASAGTFYLLERFGNHTTLYFACALNATIAGLAWLAARAEQPSEASRPAHKSCPLRAACDRPQKASGEAWRCGWM